MRVLKDGGFIKQLGVSIYTNDDLQVLIDDSDIDLIQLPFNLLDNFTFRGDLLLKAKRKGKIIHTRSAFLQGLFLKDPNDKHPVVQLFQKELVRIHEIAREQGVSITTLALSYCLAQPYIDQVIIGVDSLSQLESNVGATVYKIDKVIIQRINEIQTDHAELLNPSMWVK